MKVVKNV